MYKELKITSSMLLSFVVLRRLLFYDSICYGDSADFSETADCFLSRLKHEGCVWFCSKVYPRVNPASGGKVACGEQENACPALPGRQAGGSCRERVLGCSYTLKSNKKARLPRHCSDELGNR